MGGRPCTMIRDETFRRARTCYDHLAGQVGVALADVLQERGYVRFENRNGLITESGRQFLCEFGIALVPLPDRTDKGRGLCRTCLDGTEKLPHLAGHLGAALCARCFDLGWIERVGGTRTLGVTSAGEKGFARTFGIQLSRPSGLTSPGIALP